MNSERFQPLVEKNPENEMFRFSLAQALFEEGSLEESIPHFMFCIHKKPDWMLAHILLAKTYLEQGNPAEAIPLLKHALQLAREQNNKQSETEIKDLLKEQ